MDEYRSDSQGLAPFTLQPLGDTAVCVGFGHRISEQIHSRVLRLAGALAACKIRGIQEWVPAYTTLTVYYDPYLIHYDELCTRLTRIMHLGDSLTGEAYRLWTLPVWYGEEAGMDLHFVAEQAGMTPIEVIRIHSAQRYPVYMIGFSPGFPYLGGMDARISSPRRESPRASVPAGSVGIAGQQTGIYPLASPGGWRIIGRTPVLLYDPLRESPSLLKAGDQVEFRPINREEYEEISTKVQKGCYKIEDAVR